MRVRQFEYFVQICECGSITKAAEILHVAQPALGMQIRSLERELGVKLLRRTPRGTGPTRAGEVFLDESRAILNRVSAMRRKLSEVERAEADTVKLGLTPSMATLLTGRLLETIALVRPRTDVQIFEEFSHILLERVERGELDMALAYSVPEDCSLAREPLLREVLYFVSCPGSEFDSSEPMRFRDMVGVTFVMPSEKDFLRQIVGETMRNADLTLDVIYQVESMPAMKDLIARGKACGILPYGTISREIDAGSLRARPIADPPVSRTLYAVWPAGLGLDGKEQRLRMAIRKLLPVLCQQVESLTLL